MSAIMEVRIIIWIKLWFSVWYVRTNDKKIKKHYIKKKIIVLNVNEERIVIRNDSYVIWKCRKNTWLHAYNFHACYWFAVYSRGWFHNTIVISLTFFQLCSI